MNEILEQSFVMDRTARIPARGGTTRIRLFNGTVRRTNDWDGLRRDSQVWFADGDCLVYFYGQRASQRGASLKIPLLAIHQLQCKYLIERCVRNGRFTKSSTTQPAGPYTRIRDDADPEKVKYELYIPSPSDLSRDQAFRYHLTTRNLFAYAMGGPLVGERLSIALVDLWRRIEEWNIPVQQSEFTTYLEKQGYRDFTENTEHSLACLKLAEAAHFRDLWIDAFVNCVGMHAQLSLSPEFAGISNSTSAMVTRAALEMDLHIGKMIRAVGSFLEEDFSAVNLGLSKAARDHLDYFRSFLYGFYVNKFGYFPPPGTMPWNKRPWASMYRDFQNLYDYLADTKSSRDLNTNGFSNGGICVIQNVQNFDKRHNLTPLQHPLPLLPVTPPKQKAGITSHKSFLALGKMSSSPVDSTIIASQALATATNSLSSEVSRSPLVQEYQRFERTKPEGKLDLAEARKIRWMLVYGVLQMLTSVIKAPPEVRDSDTASYPLCVSVRDCPTWDDDRSTVKSSAIASTRSSDATQLVPQALDDLEGRTSRVSIHPDCEADCANDFFASLNISRTDSAKSLIAPLSPIKRTSSIRSSMHLSVQALQKSVVGSLTRRHSSVRRSTTTEDLRKSAAVCQVLVEDFDDQRETEKESPSPSDECAAESVGDAEPTDDAWGRFNFGFGEVEESAAEEHPSNDTTTESPDKPEEILPSPCESNFTNSSDESNDSNRSSYVEDSAESAPTEASSWDGSRRGSEASDLEMFVEPKSLGMQQSYLLSQPIIKQPPRSIALNSGTYVPKGIVSKTTVTSPSTTVKSVVYVEETVKAGKTKGPETKAPRRSSKGLTSLSNYGIVLGKTNVW